MMEKHSSEWPPALDATKAAPESHRVIFENHSVRVLEVSIPAGAREPIHHHRRSSVMIVTQPANLRYFREDGRSFDITHDPKAPETSRTQWMEPEPLHALENIDDRGYRAIRIELKEESRTA